MLLPRILTAVLLLPVVIYFVFFAELFIFNVFAILLGSLASWEWARLSGLHNALGRIGYTVVISVLLGFLYFIKLEQLLPIIHVVSVFWVFITFLIIRFPLQLKIFSSQLLSLFLGGVLLFAFTAAFMILKNTNQSEGLVLALLLMIWAADIGAYFSGKSFGKHKLSPLVSPGKTWEGVVGGVLFAIIAVLLIVNTFDLKQFSFLVWGMLTIIIVFISVAGDLFESSFKRRQSLKDSGSLLPGHGGILDRIDSLLAATPVFVSVLILFS